MRNRGAGWPYGPGVELVITVPGGRFRRTHHLVVVVDLGTVKSWRVQDFGIMDNGQPHLIGDRHFWTRWGARGWARRRAAALRLAVRQLESTAT